MCLWGSQAAHAEVHGFRASLVGSTRSKTCPCVRHGHRGGPRTPVQRGRARHRPPAVTACGGESKVPRPTSALLSAGRPQGPAASTRGVDVVLLTRSQAGFWPYDRQAGPWKP